MTTELESFDQPTLSVDECKDKIARCKALLDSTAPLDDKIDQFMVICGKEIVKDQVDYFDEEWIAFDEKTCRPVLNHQLDEEDVPSITSVVGDILCDNATIDEVINDCFNNKIKKHRKIAADDGELTAELINHGGYLDEIIALGGLNDKALHTRWFNTYAKGSLIFDVNFITEADFKKRVNLFIEYLQDELNDLTKETSVTIK